METPNSAASLRIKFVVGFAAPFSHFETTFAVTPSFPVSSS